MISSRSLLEKKHESSLLFFHCQPSVFIRLVFVLKPVADFEDGNLDKTAEAGDGENENGKPRVRRGKIEKSYGKGRPDSAAPGTIQQMPHYPARADAVLLEMIADKVGHQIVSKKADQAKSG